MKGKIAFVLGAAVGYVLGTRAGRERYEQIKRGAQGVWESAPVQRGVAAVRGAVDEKVEALKDTAIRAGKEAFANLTHSTSGSQGAARSSASSSVSSEAANPTASGAKPATRGAGSSGSGSGGSGSGGSRSGSAKSSGSASKPSAKAAKPSKSGGDDA